MSNQIVQTQQQILEEIQELRQQIRELASLIQKQDSKKQSYRRQEDGVEDQMLRAMMHMPDVKPSKNIWDSAHQEVDMRQQKMDEARKIGGEFDGIYFGNPQKQMGFTRGGGRTW